MVEIAGREIGISDDWTSTEDAQPAIDDAQETADEAVSSATGGRVGISDDFTSTEDTGGNLDVGISDDFTSMEDSGGVENVLRQGGGQLQDAVRRTTIQAPMSAVETAQQGEATWVTGDQAARGFQQADEQLTEQIDRGVEAAGLEDNRVVSGTRTATDMLITEGVRNVYGTTTGIDIEEGTDEFHTDAWAATDTALTIGTLGAGSAATRGGSAAARFGGSRIARFLGRGADEAAEAGARSIDDASAVSSRVEDSRDAFNIGDDAGQAATRTTDEAADNPLTNLGDLFPHLGDDAAEAGSRSVDDVIEAGSRTGDDTPSLIRRVATDGGESAGQGADDALALPGRVADDADETTDAFRLVDDVGEAGTRGVDDAAESGSRTTDDVTQATQRQVDEAMEGATRSRRARGGRTNRAASRSRQSRATRSGSRVSDDAADAARRSPATRAGRVSARGGDEGASLGKRVRNAFLGTRRRKIATGLGGGLVAAAGAEEAGLLPEFGSPLEEEDSLEVETEDGRSFMLHLVENLEPTREFPAGGQLREVEAFEPEGDWSKTMGYTVLLDIAGRTVTILGPDGEPMQAEIAAAQVADALARADGGYYENE